MTKLNDNDYNTGDVRERVQMGVFSDPLPGCCHTPLGLQQDDCHWGSKCRILETDLEAESWDQDQLDFLGEGCFLCFKRDTFLLDPVASPGLLIMEWIWGAGKEPCVTPSDVDGGKGYRQTSSEVKKMKLHHPPAVKTISWGAV